MKHRFFHTGVLLVSLLLSSCTYTFYKTVEDYPIPGRIRKLAELPMVLDETSGLKSSGKLIISHNDSGGEPMLYLVDEHGSLMDTQLIEDVENIDWEDVAADEQFFYIADVGNNYGKRDTLLIYKLRKETLFSGRSPEFQTISFSYAEAGSFNENGRFSHDCEAMVVLGDSIYIFSKDWVDRVTRIYAMSTSPGHYDISSLNKYDVKALITGADIDRENREVVLIGYRSYIPIVIRYQYGENLSFIEKGGKARIYPRWMTTQCEGICFGADGHLKVSAEESLRKQAIYEIKTP